VTKSFVSQLATVRKVMEIKKTLGSEATKNSVGVVQREQDFPFVSDKTAHLSGPPNVLTENAAGSRWKIANSVSYYICKCGFSGEFPLPIFGPKPKSKCCVNALPFPVE